MIDFPRRTSVALAALVALGGCAHYQAKPVDPERFPATLAERRLETPPGGAWTQADLLRQAIANSPQVAEAEAGYRVAKASARKARVGPPMTLGLTLQYVEDAGPISSWLYGLTSDLPLDLGARRSTRLDTADLVALQALYDYGEAVWTVRTALRRAVLERAAADREIDLTTRLVELRRARAEGLAGRVSAGEDARPTALTAQADLVLAERRLGDARAKRIAADIALAKALGVSPAAVVDQATPWGDAAPQAPAIGSFVQDRKAAALSRRDVLRAIADYDQAEDALRLEVARQYPEVHLGPGYTWEQGVTKLPFTLNLVLPPSDMNRAAINEAEAKRAQAGRKLETVQADLLNAVDGANAGLASSLAVWRRAQDADLPNARRTAASATAAARAGELDRTDLLAADAAVVEAELNALADWRQAWTAEIDLEDALRRPNDAVEIAVLRAAVEQTGAQR